MKNRDTITIMADYGMAPYAWLRKAGKEDTGDVGTLIADSSGFHGDYRVSKQLENDFAEWGFYFERNVNGIDDSNFDWDSFHKKGIELSKRLNDEVGHRFNIIYEKPWEDPNHEIDEMTIISTSDL